MPGAVPTIFADSKPKKKREFSEKRMEMKIREEEVSKILSENDGQMKIGNELNSEAPSTSKQMSRKRKNEKKLNKAKKLRHQSGEPVSKTKEIGIQVSADSFEIGISCDIPSDHSYMIPCPNCHARDNPNIGLFDHSYSNKVCNKVTPSSSTKKSFLKNNKSNETESEDLCLSDDDSDQISFRTPNKEYKEDPTYEPSPSCMSDTSPEMPRTARQEDNQPVKETKYLVFSSCMIKLFALIHCSTCDSPVDTDDIQSHMDGTCLTVTFTCMRGHEFKWKSQPMIGQQAAGNVLLTAAICFSGNTFTKIENLCDTFKLVFIGRTSFHRIENDYVIPSIHRLYMQQKDIITRAVRSQKRVVSGDGRCDSPGFNAKYCTYTIMDASTSAIIGFNVVQVTEAENSSSKMELIGFKRTMEDLKNDSIEIETIATDRHVQIRKYLKDNHPNINHQFDVWHLAKNIRKKLSAVANKKDTVELMPWIKSIANHLWFCASQCEGDAELLVEMWTSIVWHIQNVHDFEGEKFKRCAHQPLAAEEVRKKKWLKKGSKALKALQNIVCDKRLLKDIRQLNLFCHTGDLESYHSMMLKYVPKRQAFGYSQMVARTQLAVLDHNFNLKREVALDSQGQQRFSVMFPKATGRWGVRRLYVAKSYDFRQELMCYVVDRKLSAETKTTPHQQKSKSLPQNIAPIPAPSKSSLMEAHVSRFKKI